MSDAAVTVIDPVGVHNGGAHVYAPTAAYPIAEGDVEEVDFIFLLRVLQDALRLLDIADKMAEGILPSISETDGPFPRSRRSAEEAIDAAKRGVAPDFTA